MSVGRSSRVLSDVTGARASLPSRMMTTFNVLNTGFSISNDANIIVIVPGGKPPLYVESVRRMSLENAVISKNHLNHDKSLPMRALDCGISIRICRPGSGGFRGNGYMAGDIRMCHTNMSNCFA
ncbi:hypothetical protein JTB14_032703 [Gonioctena quinquepunctata]|nr:hypothetical protein JTB14_032703 [Gonioctena quinquepunctata]